MKTYWLGAVAAAALAMAAQPAAAFDRAHAGLLEAETAGGGGAGPQLSEAPRMGTWGFDLAGMDRSVEPGDDFFRFSNGAYLDKMEIPSDRSRFGVFDALQELSVNRMHAVLEKAAANPSATGEEAQIAAMYRSFMDEAKVNALGAKPLAGDLAEVRAAKSRDDLARLMGASMKGFGGSFFSAYIYDDAKDPERYTVYLGQAGLGLPDRDYYLVERFAPQREKYVEYITKLLTLSGWENPAEAAKQILALETRIAEVSWTRAERRDDDKTYNRSRASPPASTGAPSWRAPTWAA
jgi:putative endopeptidase